MSGINPGVFLAVCRVLVDFHDGIGNARTISGTGFWVRSGGNDCFVTNRHNLDPSIKLGATTQLRLKGVSLQVRLQSTPGNWRPDTCFVAVDNLEGSLKLHPSADVAALVNPSLRPDNAMIGHSTFNFEELGSRKFLMESVNPMDVASFVGFPGREGRPCWDKNWNLWPIRLGSGYRMSGHRFGRYLTRRSSAAASGSARGAGLKVLIM
jgi:hypothetical protein